MTTEAANLRAMPIHEAPSIPGPGRARVPPPARRVRIVAPALAIIATAWVATLTMPLALGVTPPAILVVLPREGLLAALGPGVRVLSDHPLGLILQSDDPRFAPALWRAGARVLLPAGLSGCAPE